MPQINNVIVFGDSLSDIGIKWKSVTGKLALKTGAMTVNPSGRFSDCRNWTDFMYEEAAGQTLVSGKASDTINASKVHLRLNANNGRLTPRITAAKRFFYANYAEGGATGGIPSKLAMKGALGTFKDQVDKFRADWQVMYGAAAGPNAPDWAKAPNAKTCLFLVWFGANDLYTAGAKPSAMGAVAEKVANKRRHELARIVGATNCHFIFMNLARPEASVRYQNLVSKYRKVSGTGKLDQAKDWARRKWMGDVEKEIRNFQTGADLYNAKLNEYAAQNGDMVVDIASVVHPSVVGAAIDELGLLPGAQEEGTSKRHVSAFTKNVADRDRTHEKTHMTTSDEAHPTDRVYKLMWDNIRRGILLKQCAFGNLG